MGNYDNYSFRELQLAVKKKGLAANGSKKDLIAKLEGEYSDKEETKSKDEDVNDRISRMEKMIESLLMDKKEDTQQFDIDDFFEEGDAAASNAIEPKVFQANEDDSVSETSVVGGAPEDMLLNDFLIKKRISYNELNNILRTYIGKVDSKDSVRVTTIDELEKQIQDGVTRAKEINDSSRTKVEITKDIHLVDALKNLGWSTLSIRGGTHVMEKQ
jgi:hypothetical protein